MLSARALPPNNGSELSSSLAMLVKLNLVTTLSLRGCVPSLLKGDPSRASKCLATSSYALNRALTSR